MAENGEDIAGLKEIHEKVYEFLRKIESHNKKIKESLNERVENSKNEMKELNLRIDEMSNKITNSQMKIKNFDSVLLEQDSKYTSMMDSLTKIVKEDENYQKNKNVLKDNTLNKKNNQKKDDLIVKNQLENIKNEIEIINEGIIGLESLLHLDIENILQNIGVVLDDNINYKPTLNDVIKTWENIKKCS